MKNHPVRLDEIAQKWLLDSSASERSYIPSIKAPPSRLREGFELRPDGTYLDLGFSLGDAAQDAEGTWESDEDGVVTLSCTACSPSQRKLRLAGSDEDRLILERETALIAVKLILFDLGNTLESNDVLLPGAEETLKAVQNMTGPPGVSIELALLSDWKMPQDEAELESYKNEYYDLLSALRLRTYFEPVSKYVTLSTEVGVRKPDPTLFRAAVDKISSGAPFESVCFITENLIHIDAARTLGFHAIHFKGSRQSTGDVEALPDLIPLIEEFVNL